jgi:hypothetical protein
MAGQAWWLILLAVAAIVDGLLAGASLDQSIEQLPARHRIGVRAYSAYSRASHRANGRFWLVPLGVGGAVLAVAAALWALTLHLSSRQSLPVLLAGVLGVAHTLSTVEAALINVTQWKEGVDDAALADILARFERWQAVRATLQFLTFVVAIWALTVNGTTISLG